MPEMSYIEAIREAFVEEMRRDDSIIVYGEDVRLGYAFGVTRGLVDEFGPERSFDSPMSEAAIVGSAVGAAMVGLRPVVEIQFSDFLTLTMDALVNQAAKVHYMSGGRLKAPLVVRAPFGTVGVFHGGPQHSQSLESWFMHVPGLKVATPSTPADAKGLLKTAIRDDSPVLFCEYKRLYGTKGFVPEGEHLVPFGKADIKRQGTHAMIVATAPMVAKALAAAETLSKEDGLDVLVLDMRTLSPLDKESLIACARKTNRVVIAEEDCKTGGVGGELAAILAEEAIDCLDAPIIRVAGIDAPIGATRSLEDFFVPDEKRIIDGVRRLFG